MLTSMRGSAAVLDEQDAPDKIVLSASSTSRRAASLKSARLVSEQQPWAAKRASVALRIMAVGLGGAVAAGIVHAAVPAGEATDRLKPTTQLAAAGETPPAREQQAASAEALRVRLLGALSTVLRRGEVSEGVRATNWSTTDTPQGLSQNLTASVVWKDESGAAVTVTAFVTSKTWWTDDLACSRGASTNCRTSSRADGSRIRSATFPKDNLVRSSLTTRRDGTTAEITQQAGASELLDEAPGPGQSPRTRQLAGPSELPLTDEQLADIAALIE